MCGMGLVVRQQFFKLYINRCISPIVADLKHAFTAARNIKQFLCVFHTDRERFLAKNVLAFAYGMRGDLGMCFVRRADKHGVAIFQKLFPR